ncbi:hypothetical protein PM082_010978 [Marasmius tenuissimus]|nr:hypothetical protein PM082_010978 [Marasmius tenuissimus]
MFVDQVGVSNIGAGVAVYKNPGAGVHKPLSIPNARLELDTRTLTMLRREFHMQHKRYPNDSTMPPNAFNAHSDILDYPQVDIVNLEEVKSTRSALTKAVTTHGSPSYNSLILFPATTQDTQESYIHAFLKRETASGALGMRLQTRIILNSASVVADGEDEVIDEDERNGETPLLRHKLEFLYAEGRALILKIGMFIFINVTFCWVQKAATPSPSPTPTATQVPVASTNAILEHAGPSTSTSGPPQATTGAQQSPRERVVSPLFDSFTPDVSAVAPEPSNVTQLRSKRKHVSPKSSSVKVPKLQSSNEPAMKLKSGQSKLLTFFS